MIEKVLTVKNKLGLHARAAARLVAVASKYKCSVTISRHGYNDLIDGKSILGILSLAASRGTKLNFILDGEDEYEALKAIVKVVENELTQGEELK